MIRRQGLVTSIRELSDITAEMLEEMLALDKKLGVDEDQDAIIDRKFQLNIINKTPMASDTWQFERKEIENI